MAWNMTVNVYEACSCKMACRCTLGPAEPDQEWCSGLLAFRVDDGSSDGVDLSGARCAVHAELPGDFFGGIDRARLYLDPDLSDEQRGHLEAIFHGERGGTWGAMAGAIGEWLPTTVVPISIEGGDSPTVVVGDVGRLELEPITAEDGTRATLSNAPVPKAGFGQDVLELATATNSGVDDPDMRTWESLGWGATSKVSWSG